MAWYLMAQAIARRGTAGAISAAVAAALALCAPAAPAQTPVTGFSGLNGANSKKPIDIESDRLEVDDKTHIAIFIGNVSATQGDNNLKAPRLEVIYESSSQQQQTDGNKVPAQKPVKPVKSASEPPASDPMQGSQIKIIHALGGKVVMTNKKDDQEATGTDAVYDVKAQLITMTGKEVVLIQKKNKVKGTKLVVELATGRATVINEASASGTSTPGHGRIRAVLEQEGKGGLSSINPLGGGANEKGGTAAPPQAAPAPGWQPQSR
jgi:lipopolysaccharide export system protein LptA